MTWNPITYLRERKLNAKQDEARQGKNTSGWLDRSERAAHFSKMKHRLPK